MNYSGMPPKVANQQSPYLHIPMMEALDNGTGRIQGSDAMVYRARYEAACSRVDRNFETRDKLMKSDYLDRLYAGCENDYKRVDIEHYIPKENPEQHLRAYTLLKPYQQSPCVNPSMIDPYAGKESAYHSDGMEVDDDDDEDYMDGASPSKKSKGVKKRASPKKAGQPAAAKKQKSPTKKSPAKRSPTKKAAWANVNGADQFMIKIPVQNAGLRRRPSLIAIGNTL